MLNSHAKTVLPDWRALRAARLQALREKRQGAKPVWVQEQVRLAPEERDEFYWRAYSEGRSPASLLRQFVEAYLSGATVPTIPGIARPRNRETLTALNGKTYSARYGTARVSVPLSREKHARLRDRAKAQGASVSTVLRRFVLAHVRNAPAVHSTNEAA
jgi:hypothetical protein